MNRNWKISQYCENPPRYDLLHCQDACAAYDDGEICVMALSDGAAEGSLSHIGAACIAEFSAKYFAEHFDTVYAGGFNVYCEELIKYHQAMISDLARVALAKKNVQILLGRNIQIRELNKFASSIQILAIKDDRAIYFKVGNGSAVIATHNQVITISDSVKQEPPVYVTTPNPVNLLITCDFQTFELSPSCYAIALATDGAEFENGLFFDHRATPFYEKMLEDVADGNIDASGELRDLENAMLHDNVNTLKDNIGISIMHRERIIEEPAVEIVDEPIAEEPAIEIVDEPVVEEPAVEIVDKPVVEEPAVEIVVEPIVEEPTVEIVDEPVVEEPAIEIIDEPVAEEEIGEEVEIEIIDDEDDFEIVDDPFAKNNAEPTQEKKVSRTILKFFNVSIKKK